MVEPFAQPIHVWSAARTRRKSSSIAAAARASRSALASIHVERQADHDLVRPRFVDCLFQFRKQRRPFRCLDGSDGRDDVRQRVTKRQSGSSIAEIDGEKSGNLFRHSSVTRSIIAWLAEPCPRLPSLFQPCRRGTQVLRPWSAPRSRYPNRSR